MEYTSSVCFSVLEHLETLSAFLVLQDLRKCLSMSVKLRLCCNQVVYAKENSYYLLDVVSRVS